MPDVLFLRDKGKKANTLLLEQQAIIAITRSLCSQYFKEGEGMVLSEYRMFFPAHLDILPLIAQVADDFTEMVEPESEKIFRESPFILYWDDRPEGTNDLIEQFLNPRWFGLEIERMSLEDVLYRHKPEVCVMLGDGKESIEQIRKMDYQFRTMIGFSSLIEEGVLELQYRNLADRLMMADEQFEKRVEGYMKEMDISIRDRRGTGYWSEMYSEEEKMPDLEPFVAFGAAFEMAMFR